MRLFRNVICFAFALVLSTSLAGANDKILETKLKQAFAAGELEGLHSLLVIQNGKTLAETYFKGRDERWGSGLGVRQHGSDEFHDLRSVTKSIIGLLYGIALDAGKVPALDQSLLAQFPEYADLKGDKKRDAMTIEHALSMRLGTEWNEDIPYSNPKNSEIAMEHAKDRYRYVLDRPMMESPGMRWVYNGGATAIIARIVERGTGKSIDAFAQEKLFAPLRISEFDWVNGFNGKPYTASGLRLKAWGLAKIGQMVLQGGAYEGTRVVSEEWIRASLQPHAKTKYELRYGYFWWLSPEGTPPNWAAGFGLGGQRLTIAPESKTVIVLFAGNYHVQNAWKLPNKVVTEFVIPALKK
ncbi:MAG: serine hydrolase domain-containing protein [Hyphomicrobiales bacterium]